MKSRFATGVLAVVVSVVGCRNHTSRASESIRQTDTAASVPARWLGRWDGPEGTFLQLTQDGDKYVVLIQDLDGPRSFDGVGDHGRIRFVRDGKTEYLYAGDGVASGMKWLADKKSCLMTRAGEGWCRD
jgi:hypothetical protein